MLDLICRGCWGGFILPGFLSKEQGPQKIQQNPPQNSPGLCSGKFPSDFCSGPFLNFCSLFFQGPKNLPGKPLLNSPGNSFIKVLLGFLQKPCLDIHPISPPQLENVVKIPKEKIQGRSWLYHSNIEIAYKALIELYPDSPYPLD